MIKTVKTISFIVLAFLFSCNGANNKNDDTVLARVYDIFLYESDITGIVPANSSAGDSLLIVKNYINNWIRQQLIIRQAEVNLKAEDKDFSKQLETYRNSLITFKYESFLISQNLDTIVNDQEIEEYYNNNKSNFQLKSNIVKVDYVKLEQDNAYNKRIKNLIQRRDTSTIMLDSLRYYCQTRAIDFMVEPEQWIYFDDLLKLVPINTYNQEIYLKNNTFVELKDDPFVYYINFLEFSIKDDLSPIDFEKENIKTLILNRRKAELINKMHEEIFDDALVKNDFEIF